MVMLPFSSGSRSTSSTLRSNSGILLFTMLYNKCSPYLDKPLLFCCMRINWKLLNAVDSNPDQLVMEDKTY